MIKNAVQSLSPAYFALVMATGIVSVGTHLAGLTNISIGLFWLNILLYACLFVLLIFRLLFFFPAAMADLANPSKGSGFFTLVAGTCVLGIQYQLLTHKSDIALTLWIIGLVIWVVLIYSFFLLMITNGHKPTLEKGLNGAWLLIVVSTQSLAILGTLLAPGLGSITVMILFGTLSAFLTGFLFYVTFITLILYRLLFLPENAEDFTPPYWIDMGAVAITTLAGATLTQTIETPTGSHLVDFLSFIKGISLLSWAVGTWWIPLIALLEIWRHGYKKVPVVYTPQYWSLVFPIGMYMVATWRLSEALNIPFLQPVAEGFMYIALVAWAVTFVSMCVALIKATQKQPDKA